MKIITNQKEAIISANDNIRIDYIRNHSECMIGISNIVYRSYYTGVATVYGIYKLYSYENNTYIMSIYIC